MMDYSILCRDHENMRLVQPSDFDNNGFVSVKFSELGSFENDGILKACYYDKNGELRQIYSEQGNHCGVIAATRLGKTTSCVIPTIISFAKQKVKKSLIISDPKGEIYRIAAETLRREGYKVKLLNFRDAAHSEFWNPLTPIYRKYMYAINIDKELDIVEQDGELYNSFNGVVYKDQNELERVVSEEKKALLDDVYNDIDNLGTLMVSTLSTRDPTWEDGVRELFKAFIYGMLEDTALPDNPITEETFSLDTIFRIYSTFSNSGESGMEYDKGYFSNRKEDSKAFIMAKTIVLETGNATKSSYMSTFQAKFAGYMEMLTRKVTCCNSFELEELTEGPIALFLCYRDELKAHYQTITMFVQAAYKFLIEKANSNPDGKLAVPFYFILDEFGNFAPIKDFETTISACAGRNIWFMLIVQSYAQLKVVYGDGVSAIIRDNLNVHIFLGSNNSDTLEEFSRECGQYTRISPLSAMQGDSAELTHYSVETLPLVTKSRLSHFNPGECVITEANCGYVMLSKLERYFLLKEFADLPAARVEDYKSTVNPLDEKYRYTVVPKKRLRATCFDF